MLFRSVEEHSYDLAVDRAVTDLRADEIARFAEEIMPYHSRVASENGLDLIMYEGGTHVVGIGGAIEDQALTDFFTHLNYTPEMAEIYETMIEIWQDVGGTVFNAFVDIEKPGKFGSWGHLRHLEDENPRWDTIVEFNETVEAWWETRAEGTFDHGVLRQGTGASDTLTGTQEEDILIGAGGDDFLFTSGGGDYLNGGAGTDTAYLAGAAEDYVFERQSDGLLLASNGNQTTHMRDVERLVFEDAPETSLSTLEL